MIKYPRIPHVSGSRRTNDDVFVDGFPEGSFYVFEKLDGANVGISMTESGLKLQNRGGYLENKRPHPQWDAFKNWVFSHYQEFDEMLSVGDIIFGEWLYAEHSVSYTKLPSHFVAFDYWSNGWCKSYADLLRKVSPVFAVTAAHCATNNIGDLLRKHVPESDYTSTPEGYIFRDIEDYSRVFKFVSPTFQPGKEHWFNKPIVVNKLTAD